MPYTSYTVNSLILSDFVLVKRGSYRGIKGHVIKINPTTVDIQLKNTVETTIYNQVLTVKKKDIAVKSRMFLRTKDKRLTEQKKLENKLSQLTLNKSLEDCVDDLTIM